ncbi:DUF5302 domain-containing protein [Streptosporangiaceae bacterium NEAU-GS5]|nr:DUF5302 domain-containing protein [Streptosporangiaceae bacterium NEAU-GS5]
MSAQGPESEQSLDAEGLTAEQSTGETADETADEAAEEVSDDEMKRRFREALDRKRQEQHENNAAGKGRNGSKIHGTHGQAGGKRQFRRKAGG